MSAARRWFRDLVHNCLVHPLMSFLPSRWANDLHDRNGRWAFGEPADQPDDHLRRVTATAQAFASLLRDPRCAALPSLLARVAGDGSAAFELRAHEWRLLLSVERDAAESGWSLVSSGDGLVGIGSGEDPGPGIKCALRRIGAA